jgi:chromosomal replication initiation ATPase DnaA
MTEALEFEGSLHNGLSELNRNKQRRELLNPTPNLFLGVAKMLKFPVIAQPDHDLHSCPICEAPAVGGIPYAHWYDLTHECMCVIEHPDAYSNGVRKIWQARNALPYFLKDLPERYHDYTRSTLVKNEGNSAALTALKEAGGVPNGNLYLYGTAGNGKSHVSVAVARLAAERGKSTRFWGMASLLKEVRDSIGIEGKPTPELSHWDVLVLDDIDKLKPSQFLYEFLYELIEVRWAKKKVTIFTAQHDPDETARLLTPNGSELAADPLASRMSSGLVFRIGGKDMRASKK